MKAAKKVIVVDYFVVEPSTSSLEGRIQAWMDEFGEKFDDHFILSDENEESVVKVKTLEGTSYNVCLDDNIIRGVEGEYYPCKKHIFEKTYDYPVLEVGSHEIIN